MVACAAAWPAVMVSHNLDDLVSRCDRLIWLDRGKFVADAKAGEEARAYWDSLGHG